MIFQVVVRLKQTPVADYRCSLKLYLKPETVRVAVILAIRIAKRVAARVPVKVTIRVE